MKIPRWLTIPLIAFILSRLLIFAVGLVASTMLPIEDGHWMAVPDNPFLSTWAKWDSQYYYDIATNGYWFVPGEQSKVAFFPVYPLLMGFISSALKTNIILSGFLISNISFLGALIFLYLLTELEVDSSSAQRAVFYLSFFPTSFFFNSVYTESTFLLFSISTIYFARRQLWVPSALMGMLAAATRNMGVLLWALVIWEWLRVQGWSLKNLHIKQSWINLGNGLRHHWFELIIITIIPLGLFAYMFFLQHNFERPLAFIETQAAWNRQNIGPVAVITRSITNLAGGNINKGWLTEFWNTFTLFGFLAMVPFIWKRIGEGYAIYVLIMLLVPATSATGSIIRYALTSFPTFMVLGDFGRNEIINQSLISSFAIFLGMFVSIFVLWVFVA